jgi:pimeloyl-CoA synthetase
MYIEEYKSKKNVVAGESNGQFDFLTTQIQIISDSAKERNAVMAIIKKALKENSKNLQKL